MPSQIRQAITDQYAPIVVVGMFAATWLSWSLGSRVGAWFILTVCVPLITLCAIVLPILSMRYRRWLAGALKPHRNLLVGVGSAVGAMVFVALAVLVGTVDAAAWQRLTAAGQIGGLVIGPTFTWMAALALAVWVFIGCLVHAFAPWDPLRQVAAVTAVNAAFLLPPTLIAVAYQVWRLVDLNIARTAIGS